MVTHKNYKANSLLNIASGFFLISIFLDSIINCNATLVTYVGILLGALLILLGLCNYFILFKNYKIVPDKRYGYLSLIIGIMFFASTLKNFNILKISPLSASFGLLSGFIAICLAFILLKKKEY